MENNKEKLYTLIGGVVCAIIAVIVIFIVNMNKSTDSDHSISSSEAQKKCVIMESIDGLSINNARTYCLSQWNTPEKEKEFQASIESKWQDRKEQIVDGSKITGNSEPTSLQEIYNSITGDI